MTLYLLVLEDSIRENMIYNVQSEDEWSIADIRK